MTQYIDKSALVGEIESRICHWKQRKEYCSKGDEQGIGTCDSRITELNDLLSSINTFEVKEVDLEKAIDDYIYTHDGRKRLALELNWKYCNLTLKGGNEIIKFAKHFFELGMVVSNKAQKGEEV